jgi:hypothetical protein
MAWINHPTIKHDFRSIDAISPFSTANYNQCLDFGGGGAIVNSNMNDSNYLLTATVAAITSSGGVETGDYGLLGRTDSTGNFYYLWIKSTSSVFQIAIYRYNAIMDTFLALTFSSSIPLSFFNVLRNIQFRLNGTSLKGYVDSIEYVSTTDATLSSGKAGIASSLIFASGSVYAPNILMDNLTFSVL